MPSEKIACVFPETIYMLRVYLGVFAASAYRKREDIGACLENIEDGEAGYTSEELSEVVISAAL